MLEAARANGWKGSWRKRAPSKYEGRRSRDWVKIKITSSDDFVIGGFTHGERDYFSSLVLGLYDGEKLMHAGQVGTGFNEKSLKEIYIKIEPLITKKSPFTGNGQSAARCYLGEARTGGRNQVSGIHSRRTAARAGVYCSSRPTRIRKSACARRKNRPLKDTRARSFRRIRLYEVALDIEGHRLKLTNLNKVFYPGEGITKRDVINYYDAVAPLILPHLRDRPLSLKRYPNGINEPVLLSKRRGGQSSRMGASGADFLRAQSRQDPLHHLQRSRHADLSGESWLPSTRIPG